MLFFGKKKKKKEENEERVKPKRVPKNKAFKDLKPENQRKRKEVIKPWGKKERASVLAVLVLTVGISSVLALNSRSWKLPGFPRLRVSGFSLPFFKEETILLEGNNNHVTKSKLVLEKFKKETSKLSGVYGLYIMRLTSGTSYGLYENDQFQAASLIKLPVMAALLIEVEGGRIDLDEEYALKKEDKLKGAGNLSMEPEGYRVTYRELIELMGKNSDNTAFNIIRKKLGDERIAEVIEDIGMKNTSLKDNTTTPADIGIFFERLWRGSIVSYDGKSLILDSLTKTVYEDWLAAGLPDNVMFAHKYGRELNVVNDAGIILTDEPLIVVLMSKGVVDLEADRVFPLIGQSVYEVEIQ